MYELILKKRHPFVNFLLFIFAMSITTEVLKLIFQNPSVDEQLLATSQEINKQCPYMVDSLTQLDNTIALPNHLLQYNYTFYKSDKENIDTVALKESMRESLVNKLRTDPKFAIFKEDHVVVGSRFYDRTGHYVCAMQVTPAEYAK